MESTQDLLVLTLRSFFLLAAAGILMIDSVPLLSARFVVYGSRAGGKPAQNAARPQRKNTPSVSSFSRILDHLATYQVPHAYFFHFYIFSLCCSVFWLCQLRLDGDIFRLFVSLPGNSPKRDFSVTESPPSMASSQAHLCLILMVLQASRRLYECLVLSRSSQSQMWIAHWALGLAFYGAVNMAVWIEAIRGFSNLIKSLMVRRVMASLDLHKYLA